MGVNRDPAVRLRVTCGQLKSADQFAPGRGKWVACQQTQPSRADRPGTPHDPHAAIRGPSARPGAAAPGAGGPGRLPDAVPGRTADDTRHGSDRPGRQAGGQPCAQGAGATAPPPAGSPGTRRRPVRPRGTAVLGRSPLSVARQTAVTWCDDWRSDGTAALRSRGLSATFLKGGTQRVAVGGVVTVVGGPTPTGGRGHSAGRSPRRWQG
jgi:hypothetical protein